jgi:hypothetical protein
MPRKAPEDQGGGGGSSAQLYTSASADDRSDSERMHDEIEKLLQQRDVLAGTETASALQALADAVAEPSAFLQPSAHIAEVARQAAKVRGRHSASLSCHPVTSCAGMEQLAHVPYQHSCRHATYKNHVFLH